MRIEAGAPVYDMQDQALGEVIAPGSPVPPGGTVAQVKIIPEYSDQKLFVHRGKKKSVDFVLPRPDTIMRTEIEGDRTAIEWLQMRDGIAAELSNREMRGELGRLAEWPGVPRRQAHQIVGEIGGLLPRCEVVLWETDMWEAAISGSQVFEGELLRREDVPNRRPEVWMLDRGPILEPPNLGLDRPAQLIALHEMNVVWNRGDRESWVSVRSETDGVGVAWIAILAPYLPEHWQGRGRALAVADNDPSLQDPANWLPRVKLLPPLKYGEKILPYCAPLIAARRFMSQEFIEHRPVPGSRQIARQYQRKHPEHVARVHAIALRRKKYVYPEGHQPEAREFGVQFWTQGTWCTCRSERFKVKQYYRGGCWKGPEDAPVKPPGERIYHVRR